MVENHTWGTKDDNDQPREGRKEGSIEEKAGKRRKGTKGGKGGERVLTGKIRKSRGAE